MPKENHLTQKSELRAFWKDVRFSIAKSRREQAAKTLLEKIRSQKTSVLSFCSFGSEIETGPLNRYLLNENALFLPRVEGKLLKVYRVTSLDHLITSPLGMKEPCPKKCQEVDPNLLEIFLVPGLCFDENLHRLGYGKGFYDRFLSSLTKGSFLGVAFLEQKAKTPLPSSPWDISLHVVIYC